MADLGQRIIEFVIQTRDQNPEALEDLARRLTGVSDSAGEADGSLGSMSDKLSDLVVSFTGFAGTVATFSYPIIEAAQFEKAMDGVQAVSGATDEQLARLSATARQMGAETAFSAQESAEGLQLLSAAGLDVDDAIAALPGTLQLAQAGNLSLADATDIATSAMSGFRLGVEDLGRVNDVLALSASETNTNVAELGEAMEEVAPVASALGLSFESTTAALGLLSNNGIKGSEAGTSLRGVLASLVDPSNEVKEVLDDLAQNIGQAGFQATDSSGNIKDLSVIIGEFEASGMTASQAMKIFGREAGPGLLSLLAVGSQGLREQTELLQGAEGKAQEMADTMTSNLIGTWDNFTSAVSELSITFGDLFKPAANDALKTIIDLVNGTAKWITENQTLVVAVTSVIGGAIALKSVVGMLNAGIGLVSIAWRALTTSFVESVFGTVGTWVVSLVGSFGGLSVALMAAGVAAAGFLAAFTFSESFRTWILDIQVFGVEIGKWWDLVSAKFQLFGKLADEVFGNHSEWNKKAIEDAKALVQSKEDEITAQQQLSVARQQAADLQAKIDTEIDAIEKNRKAGLEELQKSHDVLNEKLEQQTKAYNALTVTAEEDLTALATLTQTKLDEAWGDATSEKIVKSYTDTLADLQVSSSEWGDIEKENVTNLQNQISEIKRSAIMGAITEANTLYEQQLEKIKEYEQAKVDFSGLSQEQQLEKTKEVSQKIEERSKEVLEKKKEYYERARASLQTALEESLSSEKSIADEIIKINEKVSDSKKTAEELIRDLKRENMTDEEKYQDQLKEFDELMTQSVENRGKDFEKSSEYAEAAMKVAANLTQVSKEGTQDNTVAIQKIQEAQQAMEAAGSSRTGVLESSLQQTEANSTAIKNSLSAVDKGFEAVEKRLEKGFTATVAVATEKLDADLAELQKTTQLKFTAEADFDKAFEALKAYQLETTELQKNAVIKYTDEIAPSIKAFLDSAPLAMDKLKEEVKLKIEKGEKLSEVDKSLLKISGYYKELEKEVTLKISKGENLNEAELQIKSMSEKLNALDKEPHEIDVKVDGLDGGISQADTLSSKLDSLDNRTTHSYHVIHESTVQENSTGGKIHPVAAATTPVLHASTGAKIPGYGGGDTVPAMVEPGEVILTKEAAAKKPDDYWNDLNAGKEVQGFAEGGSTKDERTKALIEELRGDVAAAYESDNPNKVKAFWQSQWKKEVQKEEWEELNTAMNTAAKKMFGLYQVGYEPTGSEVPDLDAYERVGSIPYATGSMARYYVGKKAIGSGPALASLAEYKKGPNKADVSLIGDGFITGVSEAKKVKAKDSSDEEATYDKNGKKITTYDKDGNKNTSDSGTEVELSQYEIDQNAADAEFDKKWKQRVEDYKNRKGTYGDGEYSKGGSPLYASTGMRIPGYGGGDSVPLDLKPNSWVIRKEAVAKYGDEYMRRVADLNNTTGYAAGGNPDGSVPVVVEPGEWVFDDSVTDKRGSSFMHALNSMTLPVQRAIGGMIPSVSNPFSMPHLSEGGGIEGASTSTVHHSFSLKLAREEVGDFTGSPAAITNLLTELEYAQRAV